MQLKNFHTTVNFFLHVHFFTDTRSFRAVPFLSIGSPFLPQSIGLWLVIKSHTTCSNQSERTFCVISKTDTKRKKAIVSLLRWNFRNDRHEPYFDSNFESLSMFSFSSPRMLENIYPTKISLANSENDEIKRITSLWDIWLTDVYRFTIHCKLNALFTFRVPFVSIVMFRTELFMKFFPVQHIYLQTCFN